MDEPTLLDKFNTLVDEIPLETLLHNLELLEYVNHIRHEFRPKDRKGGRPKTYAFNGPITVWLVDDVHERLRDLGIRDKQLAYKMVAWHYFRASPHALKRHYDQWKSSPLSARTKAILKQSAWSDERFMNILKIYRKVQN